MHAPSLVRSLAAGALVAALVGTSIVSLAAPAPSAEAPAPAASPPHPASPGPPPALVSTKLDSLPLALDSIDPDVPAEGLTRGTPAPITVRVLVDEDGCPRDVRPARGTSSALDHAAVDAAWWTVFRPALHGGKPTAAWTTFTVRFPEVTDVEPLDPADDVTRLARDAEADGDFTTALAYWTGAISRARKHPGHQNVWNSRAQAIRVAKRIRPEPPMPPNIYTDFRYVRSELARAVSSASFEKWVGPLNEILLATPWDAESYRLLAAACAGSNQRADATRATMCYRLAASDSAQRARAARALHQLAAKDLLGASVTLKPSE